MENVRAGQERHDGRRVTFPDGSQEHGGPSDIIATGTPEGVGMGRRPQEWLHDGDIVETEVEGIGVMRNRITDLEPRRPEGTKSTKSLLDESWPS